MCTLVHKPIDTPTHTNRHTHRHTSALKPRLHQDTREVSGRIATIVLDHVGEIAPST